MPVQPNAALDFQAASPVDGAYIVEVMAITAALLVAAYGVLWLIRRMKMPNPASRPPGALKVVDRIQIGPHTRLSVVEYKETRLFLAESNRHVSLRELGAAETPAEAIDD